VVLMDVFLPITGVDTVQHPLAEDTSLVRELAKRVDELQSKAQPMANVAAVAAPAAEIAAVEKKRHRNKSWTHKKPDSRKRRHSDNGEQDGQGDAKKKPKPWQTIGICWAHHHYGDRAKNCKDPACWRETNNPSMAQRHRCRDAGSHHRPANGSTLPFGHRRLI